MKHQKELTQLIDDIRTCAIDTQAECMAILELQRKQPYNTEELDALPFLRPFEEFLQLWKEMNIEERISRLLPIQFFDDEPQTPYQTRKRLDLIQRIMEDFMHVWEFLQVIIPYDGEFYPIYEATFCQLRYNLSNEMLVLQKMYLDDWDEENLHQETPNHTKAIQPEPKPQPKLTETATEQMQGKAQVTDWLIEIVDYDEERAETIVNRLNNIPIKRRTAKPILNILRQENADYENEWCYTAQFARNLTECTGVEVTDKALNRHKPDEYKKQKNK